MYSVCGSSSVNQGDRGCLTGDACMYTVFVGKTLNYTCTHTSICTDTQTVQYTSSEKPAALVGHGGMLTHVAVNVEVFARCLFLVLQYKTHSST